MIPFRTFWVGCFFLCVLAQSGLAVTPPPAPKRYVEDQSVLLPPAEAEKLNQRLEDYEKQTSNQIVVAIYPALPQGAELAQFSTAVFEAWGVGQKKQDNGIVIFIFSQDRKMFIATGRGLEGAVPDAICKTIITEEMVPRFKQGDYAGGIDAAVTALMSAVKGEYQGNGSTNASSGEEIPFWVVLLFLFLLFMFFNGKGSRPVIYTRRGAGSWSSGSSWGGGGWGGGGGSSGGFSGGGGSTSGGGAGGSW